MIHNELEARVLCPDGCAVNCIFCAVAASLAFAASRGFDKAEGKKRQQAWDETNKGSEFHNRMAIRMAAQFEQQRCMQRKGLERRPKGIFETARAHAQPPPRTYRDVGPTSTRLKAPAHRAAPRAPPSTHGAGTRQPPPWLHGSAFHAPQQEDRLEVERSRGSH